ncbi:hypothetical protein DS832_07825 [Bombilactobacillus bombi]|uniref:Uncharacterized protein n=1 Tax=Bombilactobacillus bombi TaxID=1303590 RepID=A0A3R7CK97_9LACO|nr:hypothetical protein [Bombilactobacillus bombi]RHW45423.1 hypothetical protein DS832_07825 [Bombilactobacillus bombi]
MANKRKFSIGSDEKREFTQLVKKPSNGAKEVKIAGAYNFGSASTFTSNSINENNQVKKQKQGRPVEITDVRYKVCKPKKISPALESKLACLQDYMIEFADETKRITFDKMVDTLANSYIDTKLVESKREHLKKEIKKDFDNLDR